MDATQGKEGTSGEPRIVDNSVVYAAVAAINAAKAKPTTCEVCRSALNERGNHDLRGLTPQQYELAKQEMMRLHNEAAGKANQALLVDGMTVEVVSTTEYERDARGEIIYDPTKVENEATGEVITVQMPRPKVLKRGTVVALDTATGKVRVRYEDGTESFA